MAVESSRSKEVSRLSTMIKQGYIPDSSLSFSPSRAISRVSPSSSPCKTPSPPPSARVRASPTLFEMMSEEQGRETKQLDDKCRKSQERVWKILAEATSLNPDDDEGIADVGLTISSKDGIRVLMNVHSSVLTLRSEFFAEKFGSDESLRHSVEICDCDDVEVFAETVALMYFKVKDVSKRLMRQKIGKVLSLLKVSVDLKFSIGSEACLEFLEGVPWSEEEEEKVVSALLELQSKSEVTHVLGRLSYEPCMSLTPNDAFLTVLNHVLLAKDGKSQLEMKTLISRLLKEDPTCPHPTIIDTSVNELYGYCNTSIDGLIKYSSEVASMDIHRKARGDLRSEIAREAVNMQWIIDILIERRMGDGLVDLWAKQKELACFDIPPMYRYEISRITTQLCIAIGRGQLVADRTSRASMFTTWMQALYDDYVWMKRACRSFDKTLVEEGLCHTILTLPLSTQQNILLAWCENYLNKGDDCPNLQRAFEIWWRRSFVKQYSNDPDLDNCGSLVPVHTTSTTTT